MLKSIKINKEMNQTTQGWVVINENHPSHNRKYLSAHTFANTRTESIKLFIKGSGQSWKYWYRKYNFRCVKAESTIKTIE